MTNSMRTVLGNALVLSFTMAVVACMAAPAGPQGGEPGATPVQASPQETPAPQNDADGASDPTALPLSNPCLDDQSLCVESAAACQSLGGVVIALSCRSQTLVCCAL